ncbi:ferritin-like fold-containing protein [Actinotalea sp. K2]|uniref:ferritin-like fold-containing protein n=1 Tax=Actinotalea sp. K2 TaxID=2939438 RepID=UPI0020171FF7|nr:ferritin-like fold-containing protein [Actinotalea sp. K2]MCL3859864.1 ferritin-like domain-containing protein [Actinotalea sp. K2]
MTGQTPSSTSAPPLSHDEVGRALAVLGMTASSELAAFSRLAADAALAPVLGQRLELSGLAGTALRRLERIGARVRELGGDLETVMAPFSGVLVDFDGRTVPSTWWERLLKAYVGYGIADDFSRIAAGALDPVTREIVLEVLTDDGHAQLVVDSLAAAGEQDPALASRLALWGRRLVGEALGVVQRLLADHAEMRDLLGAAIPSADGAEAQSRLFATLTAEHTRRMDRLGLTA